jgi:methionyl-tRNA formyltransferase
MKIALLCHGTVLLPAIEALASQNLLVGIAVPDIFAVANHSIFQVADSLNISCIRLTQEMLENQLDTWLHEVHPDVICMMGFPYKIPGRVLSLPRFGFFNLHGGRLPKYAGPDPIFWQLKNLEMESAITVHRVENNIDTGKIAHVEPVPLGPQDTYGIVLQRMGHLLPRALMAFIQQLAVYGNNLALTPQKNGEKTFCKRPREKDQTINWSLSARSIHALVRACNPIYGGALTAIKGIPLKILQVVEGENVSHDLPEPGTIVHIDEAKGIEIACGENQTLFANIFCIEAGFFVGNEIRIFFTLFPGNRFATA